MMGWFSKKSDAPATGVFQWATNAPSHWPPVFSDELNPKLEPSMKIMYFKSKIMQSWEKIPGTALKIGGPVSFLYKAGIIDFEFSVVDNGITYPVLLLRASNAKAASVVNGYSEALKARGITIVYYAPKPLPQVNKQESPHRPLVMLDLEKWEGPLNQGKAYMWWSSKPGERFSTAGSLPDMDRALRALDGYGSFFWVMLGKQLGVLPQDFRSSHLPDDPVVLYTKGPENQLLVFSVSKERGVRLHFPVEGTTITYRDNFWHNFAAMAEDFRAQAVGYKMPMNSPDDRQGLGQWEFMKKGIAEQENKGHDSTYQVGGIVFGNG
jgi:hypothetical protein